MNWLDCLLIAILLFSVVMSARKGFSREIIGLAAASIALVLGMWFYGLAGSFLLPYVSSARVANLIGFLLVVFAVMLLGGMVGWVVNRFLRTIGLSFFDRLLGAAFGFVRGMLIVIALLTAYMAFGPEIDSKTVSGSVLHSRIAPYVLDASHLVVAIAPMELKSSFTKQYAQVKTLLEKTHPHAMTKENQDLMKERFDVLIDDVMTAGFFLEQAVEVLEKGMIDRALQATKANQSEASKLLGIHRNTLQRKMLEYKIDGKRPHRKPVSRAQPKTVRRRKAS